MKKKDNLFIEILGSLPVILLALYFSIFLGVVLIILRYFSTNTRKKNRTPVILLFVGLLVLLPKGLNIMCDTFNLNPKNIPYLNDIMTSSLYTSNFMRYSKALIIIGIVFAVLSYFINKIIIEVKRSLKSEMSKYADRQLEDAKENDYKIKDQQEKAKNTHAVTCKKCGGSNIIVGKFGKCKYCRSILIDK